METSLDLPDTLASEIKLHAEHQRQELKDAIAELLRQGLAVAGNDSGGLAPPKVKTHPKTGLPYVECPHAASPDRQ